MMLFNTIQNKIYEAWAQTVFKASTLITDTVGLGFRPVWSDMVNYIQKYIGFNNISKDAWILVLNDFDLTATKALREMGYYNIILLVTDTTKEQTPTTYFFDVKFNDRKFRTLFPNGWSKVWKDVWFLNAAEVQNVSDKGKLLKTTHIEYRIQGDTPNMNFDLIIANPPYGKIGAVITDKIRKEVKYNHFVNLLPANDYKRVAGLHQYVRNMVPVNNGFTDATVTTHLCEVVKVANDMTAEEFEIGQYIDPQLDKYFKETIKRESTFTYSTNTPIAKFKTIDITKTVVLGAKDVNHKHLPYSKSCVQYRWNVAEDVDAEWVEAHYSCVSSKKEKQTSLFVIYLASAEEKKALVDLLYSASGFKFIQKLWKAINLDSYCMPDKYLPKLPYYVGMTWEDVLLDYGYTETEIAEVMADLENFKDMERD